MAPAKPAAGAVGRLAVARCARFCKEVQRLRTAPRASQIGGGLLEAAVCKGQSFKNKRFVEFSLSEQLASGELLACSRSGINLPESRGASGFSYI